MITRLLAPLLLGLSLLFLAHPPEAKAQVIALSCSVTMTDISFGSFDVLPGASVSSNATLSVSCLNITVTTGNLYLCVALPPRSMLGSTNGNTLAYDIFGPTPLTTSWSNTTPIVIPFASLRLFQTYSINVNAMVAGSQQTKQPDNYSQTLAATTSYGSTSCTSGLPGTGSFTFRSTATVLKSCNVSASNLSFGSVGDLNSIVDGQSALSVQCSRGTGYSIALNGGLSGAIDPTARKMTFGSATITYGLYQNSARTLGWGTTSTMGGTGTASTQSIPVYGRVPVQAPPLVGTYSDTIVATVTY